MLRTAALLPLTGLSTLGFDTPGVSPRRRQSATGPPGSYPDRTSTGRRQRAYDSRSATSRRPPSLLGARKREVRRRLLCSQSRQPGHAYLTQLEDSIPVRRRGGVPSRIGVRREGCAVTTTLC